MRTDESRVVSFRVSKGQYEVLQLLTTTARLQDGTRIRNVSGLVAELVSFALETLGHEERRAGAWGRVLSEKEADGLSLRVARRKKKV